MSFGQNNFVKNEKKKCLTKICRPNETSRRPKDTSAKPKNNQRKIHSSKNNSEKWTESYINISSLSKPNFRNLKPYKNYRKNLSQQIKSWVSLCNTVIEPMEKYRKHKNFM